MSTIAFLHRPASGSNPTTADPLMTGAPVSNAAEQTPGGKKDKGTRYDVCVIHPDFLSKPSRQSRSIRHCCFPQSSLRSGKDE
ncbi:hypothetical protein RSAG8_04030, partial [Rhizoctonia solani AG-8 WAC10335]